MSSKTGTEKNTPAITPRQTMKGHTDEVTDVVHLPQGQRIITCSWDGSLRLWDLESGAQIGEDWRDDEEKKSRVYGMDDAEELEARVYGMALSPNGKTVVSGSGDWKVKLWDVETGKVIAKWVGHPKGVGSVCWSADGKRVLSGGYYDETSRVWDVKSGETILEIKTGHGWVYVVRYSPDNTKIATGGSNGGVKIWNAANLTGELLVTLKHDNSVYRLAWTSDGKKLVSEAEGLIRIFDTATWQEIAVLEGHTDLVSSISLSQNNRLLASTSRDKTVRLWNLDTNLPVCPPLQHEDQVECATFSADGKVLVTGCSDKNAYIWDVHAIIGVVDI